MCITDVYYFLCIDTPVLIFYFVKTFNFHYGWSDGHLSFSLLYVMEYNQTGVYLDLLYVLTFRCKLYIKEHLAMQLKKIIQF